MIPVLRIFPQKMIKNKLYNNSVHSSQNKNWNLNVQQYVTGLVNHSITI